MELDNILDELDDVLSSAGSIPVLNYKLVKASDVDMILEKLRGAVPLATTQQYDRDMRAAADAYADKLHSESMQYAMDVFNYLEENLNKTLTAVRDNGQALRSSYESDNQIESGDRK